MIRKYGASNEQIWTDQQFEKRLLTGLIPQEGLSGLNFLHKLVLQSHVVLGGQTNASTEDVFNAGLLLEERVDDGSAGRSVGSLQQVAQHGENGVESVPFLATLYTLRIR
jgi:hypothetical protein